MQGDNFDMPEFKPTYQYLDELDRRRRIEQDNIRNEEIRVRRCYSHRICPSCGAQLVNERVEILEAPRRYLFGLIKITKKVWDYRVICSRNKNHFEDKGFFVDDCMY